MLNLEEEINDDYVCFFLLKSKLIINTKQFLLKVRNNDFK